MKTKIFSPSYPDPPPPPSPPPYEAVSGDRCCTWCICLHLGADSGEELAEEDDSWAAAGAADAAVAAAMRGLEREEEEARLEDESEKWPPSLCSRAAS